MMHFWYKIILLICFLMVFSLQKIYGVRIKMKRIRRPAFNVYKAKEKCFSSVNEEYFQVFPIWQDIW